ncbi:hypothetical protein HPP92_026551 [Vanilla planifolia]|uniref:Uncharacterized protein n=1 Tax=Vanilla planifolia TaxID=51239 RepID=A0A835PG39_VANPL|nr:hypothetical protein HPP92_026551 [Vanilla planifolia]
MAHTARSPAEDDHRILPDRSPHPHLRRLPAVYRQGRLHPSPFHLHLPQPQAHSLHLRSSIRVCPQFRWKKKSYTRVRDRERDREREARDCGEDYRGEGPVRFTWSDAIVTVMETE